MESAKTRLAMTTHRELHRCVTALRQKAVLHICSRSCIAKSASDNLSCLIQAMHEFGVDPTFD